MKKFSVLCSAFALSTGVHASCGAAFCTLLNDRFALGTWEHVGWSADVRLESVTQDRLHSGTKTLAPSDVNDEDAIERHTRNLNLVTTLSLSPGLSVALAGHDTVYGFVQLPLYQRVNGIQLVPRASLALGWPHSF